MSTHPKPYKCVSTHPKPYKCVSTHPKPYKCVSTHPKPVLSTDVCEVYDQFKWFVVERFECQQYMVY